MITLFISYAHEDKTEFAEPLVSALKGYFRVWIDGESLTAGDGVRKKRSLGNCATKNARKLAQLCSF